MLDLLIRGGRVVTPTGVGELDIGVQGERIAVVATPGSLTEEASRTIDATGKLVVPGGVEAHAHAGNAFTPERSGAEAISLAAIYGGTTMVLDFAQQAPGGDLVQAIEDSKERWAGRAYTDYSFHPILMHGATPEVIAQVGPLVDGGFPTIKIFTTSMRPDLGGRPSNFIDFGRLAEIMEQVTAHGGMMFVHGEDEDIVQYNYERAKAFDRWDWPSMHLIHSNLSEDLSFRRVIRLAEHTGVAVYLVHVSAKEGVNAIADARSRGLPIYGETLHNYVTFNADNYKESNGMKYHTYPSLKFEDDRLRLWDGLLHGDLSTMATDVVSTTWAVKIQGRTVADVMGGHNGIETRMGITYTEGVVKRGMSLERFVAITSTNPAKLVGLYPRKGAIASGSDADIAIIDTSIRKKLSMDDLHLEDYSIWEGWEIQGWPVTTILRGKVVLEDGKLQGGPGDGQLIPRKMTPEVLAGPVC
ncbi:MAG: amidohydrolase family protein [Dehalococcoidia bacterium]